jgi:hypothetical protein
MNESIIIDGLYQVYFIGSIMALIASIITYKIVRKK